MALLNYRTSVKAGRSAGELQEMLAKAGASGVGLEYDTGAPAALRFVIDGPLGRQSYLLPVNPGAVGEVLRREGSLKKLGSGIKPIDVAWRIVKDWVEAQLAIIQTEMVTLDQVMLPYMLTDTAGTTVYEAMLNRTLQLNPGDRVMFDADNGETIEVEAG